MCSPVVLNLFPIQMQLIEQQFLGLCTSSPTALKHSHVAAGSHLLVFSARAISHGTLRRPGVISLVFLLLVPLHSVFAVRSGLFIPIILSHSLIGYLSSAVAWDRVQETVRWLLCLSLVKLRDLYGRVCKGLSSIDSTHASVNDTPDVLHEGPFWGQSYLSAILSGTSFTRVQQSDFQCGGANFGLLGKLGVKIVLGIAAFASSLCGEPTTWIPFRHPHCQIGQMYHIVTLRLPKLNEIIQTWNPLPKISEWSWRCWMTWSCLCSEPWL